MKFDRGDKTYQALVEVAGHELYVATEKYKLFNQTLPCLEKSEMRYFKVACYQAYAEFVRGLYEYYLAIINWNTNTTRLSKSDNLDAAMNDTAQRLLNFYRPLRSFTEPKFPLTVPIDFGAHFRQVRNRVSHADFRRMGPDLRASEITLASFYQKYNFYVHLMLEHPQFTWGGKKFDEAYTWGPIEEFISAVKPKST